MPYQISRARFLIRTLRFKNYSPCIIVVPKKSKRKNNGSLSFKAKLSSWQSTRIEELDLSANRLVIYWSNSMKQKNFKINKPKQLRKKQSKMHPSRPLWIWTLLLWSLLQRKSQSERTLRRLSPCKSLRSPSEVSLSCSTTNSETLPTSIKISFSMPS